MKKVIKTICSDGAQPTFTLMEKDTPNGWPRSTWRVQGCRQDTIHITQWYYAPGQSSIISDADVGDLARFSMDCDEIDIQFINLQTRGVSGCDKRLTYIIGNAGWIVNAISE